MMARIGQALIRAWKPILLVLCVHAGAVAVGLLMAQRGDPLALRWRDRLVARAYAHDPASVALARGQRVEAAAWDFSRNLFLAVVPATVGGLAIAIPYLTAAYRGWIGGIVGVDSRHVSRLADPAERTYYLVTLALQIVPYSLAAGAGVQLGLAYLRRRRAPVPLWFGLPREAVLDVLWTYALVVPLLMLASMWEFLRR